MEFTGRLTKNCAFRRVYRRGQSAANYLLVLYTLPNETGGNNLGISISKKVGNAVTRNRIKRLVRESYRHAETGVSPGYDLVVVARAAAGKLTRESSFHKIDGALRFLLRKRGLLLPVVP